MNDQCRDNRQSGCGGTVRRGLLRGLAASAATVAVGRFGGESSAKPKKAKKSLCRRCPKICESPHVVFCRPTPNIATEECVCARAASGGSTCVNIAGGLGCAAADQCAVDANCPAGHACIKVDAVHCCPPPDTGEPAPTGNLCMPICKPAT